MQSARPYVPSILDEIESFLEEKDYVVIRDSLIREIIKDITIQLEEIVISHKEVIAMVPEDCNEEYYVNGEKLKRIQIILQRLAETQ